MHSSNEDVEVSEAVKLKDLWCCQPVPRKEVSDLWEVETQKVSGETQTDPGRSLRGVGAAVWRRVQHLWQATKRHP